MLVLEKDVFDVLLVSGDGEECLEYRSPRDVILDIELSLDSVSDVKDNCD